MFSIEFLHVIRHHELAFVERYLPVRARILEIGGGTGLQAKLLSERGFDMVSIDLPQSNYADQRVFPVVDYDGSTIPFPDQSFDVVFSSNVLEHVREPGRLHNEIRRVLRSGGYCLHAMPSGAWSFWTIVTHYLSAVQRAGGVIASSASTDSDSTDRWRTSAGRLSTVAKFRSSIGQGMRRVRSVLSALIGVGRNLRTAWYPPRHGEFGNAFTEIVTFGRRRWRRHFRTHGYQVLMVRPMGLFYTGYMLWGASWPLQSRERAARWLGSACILYKLVPHTQPRGSSSDL